MYHYIIKNEIRPDGTINNVTTTRSSFSTGLAEYYAECAKAPTNESLVSTHIVLMDEKLNKVEKADIAGAYVATETA